MVSHRVWMPTEEELSVPQDIDVSTPSMKAAAYQMHVSCEHICKEYMLCRKETEDPRRCLEEGKAVTACGVKFLQRVKKLCRPEFEGFADCLDHQHEKLYAARCKPSQRVWDECARQKMGLERPRMGYFARPHVHASERPKPPPRMRDFIAASRLVMDELPADYPMKNEYKDNLRDHPIGGVTSP